MVVSKLRAHTALEYDRRHYKAAKALVVIIPLLGFTYMLTLVGPTKEESPLGFLVFNTVRAALLSSQGAVISLPYCFLNAEVQAAIKLHWDRWWMVRTVGMESQSARTSLGHSIHQAERSFHGNDWKVIDRRHSIQEEECKLTNQEEVCRVTSIGQEHRLVTLEQTVQGKEWGVTAIGQSL